VGEIEKLQPVIVRGNAKFCVTPPPDALIVMLEVATAACAVEFKVSMLAPDPPETLVGENVAVTPAGNPLAESATAELNPDLGETVIDAEALPPCLKESEPGDALNWKLGVATEPFPQLLTSTAAFTEPRPVAMSYPTPAE
jgi:hypothetical protein